MASNNPFSIVYNAIWDQLHSDSEYEYFIKNLNEVRHDEVGGSNLNAPRKTSISDADLPELELLSLGLVGNLKASSSQTDFWVRYAFVLATGDFAYTKILAPLQWVLLRNLINFRDEAPPRYLWEDEQFIKRVTFEQGDDLLTDTLANRGITAWSSILQFRVNIIIRTDYLKTKNILIT